MITPTWAIEPPTAQGDTFPFLDMSNAGPGISRLQTSFESPLKTSLNFHDSRDCSTRLPYHFSSTVRCCAAIDPSALQPPLGKLQAEFGLANNETSYIISPFINHVMEHGPDGTMTGRYSRPLTSTGRPSHARKTPPGHVKRPRNAFILFRSHACSSNLIPPTVEKDHRQISRIAEEEKDLHRKLHPDYRYKPIYRKENSGKKNQGRSPSSSAAKKKAVTRKKRQRFKCSKLRRSFTESEDFTGLHKKSPADLLRERDEEIRCEIVAKVLMETKLSGSHWMKAKWRNAFCSKCD
ncbi:hypothetical protein H4Q26_007543 [Puccinia striiformis f. sp. tritici PST-130]|nr:hypothetical protein H4Q26_007543 [Puccinia striiformis f. sp. tritici PST-130]